MFAFRGSELGWGQMEQGAAIFHYVILIIAIQQITPN